MTRYSALRYTVPPNHSNSIGEIAYALTPDEVVRRTLRHLPSGSVVTYETADLASMSGEFEPSNRAPWVIRDAWTAVDGEDETPE